MLKTLTLGAGLMAASLFLAPTPSSAAPLGVAAMTEPAAAVETVQYGYGGYGGRGYGRRGYGDGYGRHGYGGGRHFGHRFGGREFGFGRGRGHGYGHDRGYGRRSYY
ncbi:hypothetical protein [Methylobacterium sp. Leaf89]|jgi:hypothetical protein|uniref:hypothetical protein n=1 Tax=Methylobacterium sp. Leaf89 TaxID=1736245 RepID=UPI0009EB637A|nr:hypothetical protein [Methylobacterium sp. Leaf89]